MNVSAKCVVGSFKAHAQELVSLKFYDDQYQLVTVAENGNVCLWDS